MILWILFKMLYSLYVQSKQSLALEPPWYVNVRALVRSGTFLAPSLGLGFLSELWAGLFLWPSLRLWLSLWLPLWLLLWLPLWLLLK